MTHLKAARLLVEQLEDRLTPSSNAIPAGQFNWTQVSPNGTLTQLVWQGQNLLYQTWNGSSWNSQTVTTSTSFSQTAYTSRDQMMAASQTAQLVFTTNGTANALVLEKQWNGQEDGYETLIEDFQLGSSGWKLATTIEPSWVTLWGPNNLVAEAGPSNSISLIFTETSEAAGDPGQFGAGTLWYATNQSGKWAFSQIAATADLNADLWIEGSRYAPRFLSLAVTPSGAAYVTYTPEFYVSGAFGTIDSTLKLATNASGSWQSQTVVAPINGGPGDAGLGASVAVAPDGQVAVASYYVERYSTGSDEQSWLMYSTLNPGGGWTTTTAVSTPDGYVAGDGPNYTGFAPELMFNAQSQPTIIFSDEADQHLAVTYENEFAGQIRTTSLVNGSWQTTTVLAQSDPLVNQLFYPLAVIYKGETVYAGVEATSTLDSNDNPTSMSFSLADVFVPSSPPVAPPVVSPPVSPPPVVVSPPVSPPPVIVVPPVSPPPVSPPPVVVSPPVSPPPVSPPPVVVSPPPISPPVSPPPVIVSPPPVSPPPVSPPPVVVSPPPVSPPPVVVVSPPVSPPPVIVSPPVSPPVTSPPVAVSPPPPTTTQNIPVLATASAPGVATVVSVTYSNGESYWWDPFGSSFTGGASVALGDVSGNGVPDIIVASGSDGTKLTGTIQVYNGLTRDLIATYAPLGTYFNGLNVAVGDIADNGKDDIVVGVAGASWPYVAVLNGQTGAVIDEFLAYPTSFKSGIRVSVGDMNDDGHADVIVSPNKGPTGEPVEIFSGKSIITGTANPAELTSFAPFGASYTGGISIAAGMLSKSGPADLVVGMQTSGDEFLLYTGPSLTSSSPPQPLLTENAWTRTDNSGIMLAMAPDETNTSVDDLIVTDGSGTWTARFLNSDLTPSAFSTADAEYFEAIPGMNTPVYIG